MRLQDRLNRVQAGAAVDGDQFIAVRESLDRHARSLAATLHQMEELADLLGNFDNVPAVRPAYPDHVLIQASGMVQPSIGPPGR